MNLEKLLFLTIFYADVLLLVYATNSTVKLKIMILFQKIAYISNL